MDQVYLNSAKRLQGMQFFIWEGSDFCLKFSVWLVPSRVSCFALKVVDPFPTKLLCWKLRLFILIFQTCRQLSTLGFAPRVMGPGLQSSKRAERTGTLYLISKGSEGVVRKVYHWSVWANSICSSESPASRQMAITLHQTLLLIFFALVKSGSGTSRACARK